MQRRGFLSAVLAAGFAPAAVGSGILMPINTKIVGYQSVGDRMFASINPMDSANVRAMMQFIELKVREALTFYTYEDYYGPTIHQTIQRMADEIGVKASVHVEGQNLSMMVTAPSLTVASNIVFS